MNYRFGPVFAKLFLMFLVKLCGRSFLLNFLIFISPGPSAEIPFFWVQFLNLVLVLIVVHRMTLFPTFSVKLLLVERVSLSRCVKLTRGFRIAACQTKHMHLRVMPQVIDLGIVQLSSCRFLSILVVTSLKVVVFSSWF